MSVNRDDQFVRLSAASARVRIVLGLALLLSFGVGGFFAIRAFEEDPGEDCGLVACVSGISVRMDDIRSALPRAATVQLCAGPGCVSEKLRRGGAPWVSSDWQGVPKDPGARYTADLTVFDRRGRVLMHLRRSVVLSKFEPDGACGPTCYFAGLLLQATRGRLVAVRS